MVSGTHSYLAAALCLGSLASMACLDAAEDAANAIQPKGRPDSLPCPEHEHAKQITYNKLGSLSVMFNALSTNPEAIPRLIGAALHSHTYDRMSYPDAADEYLSRQLEDPWAREYMRYVVSCALTPAQSLTWTDPVTLEPVTWTGDNGLCPAWHSGGIQDNPACQELVSACILARNNALGAQVRISLRGIASNQALMLSPALAGGIPGGVESIGACTQGEDFSTERNCGFSVQHVGMCEPGTPVQIQAEGASCTDALMARVCEGPSACDADGPVVAATPWLCNTATGFACPDKGSFTVMTAPIGPTPPSSVALAVAHAVYPVSEPVLYNWREGAFYGNMFAVESLDPRISMEMTSTGLSYTFAGSQSPSSRRRLTAPASCGRGDRDAQRRLAWHEWFMRKIDLQEDLIVHRNLFACWDPTWTEGAAYAAERICAGRAGADVCAAKAVGPCWHTLGTDNTGDNLCTTDDSTTVLRDRDYDQCTDGTGRIWNHPLTVFLDDPCALVPGACAVHAVSEIAAGAGSSHSCALMSTGEVRCWGSNLMGQLGHGNTSNIGDNETAASARPVDAGGRVVKLALGSIHSCALFDTGEVRCWGSNSSGQLGQGNTATIGDNESPASAGTIDVGGTVVDLAAGFNHSCALLDTGDVRCWGINNTGQLGYGNTSSIGDNEHPADVGTVALGGTAIQIAAGGSHTCALLSDARLRCWGQNNNGQLGYGNTIRIGDNELPTAVGPVDIGGAIARISLGINHTCALRKAGGVHCWGQNNFGQLGYGHLSNIGDNEPLAPVGKVPVF